MVHYDDNDDDVLLSRVKSERRRASLEALGKQRHLPLQPAAGLSLPSLYEMASPCWARRPNEGTQSLKQNCPTEEAQQDRLSGDERGKPLCLSVHPIEMRP